MQGILIHDVRCFRNFQFALYANKVQFSLHKIVIILYNIGNDKKVRK